MVFIVIEIRFAFLVERKHSSYDFIRSHEYNYRVEHYALWIMNPRQMIRLADYYPKPEDFDFHENLNQKICISDTT